MSKVNADWNSIKEDYLLSGESYRKISQRYDVSYGELSKVAAREGWHKERQKLASNSITREERILAISDRLLDKIEKSISELDRCIVKNKEKTKTVEYDCDTKKPINEVVEEKEDIQVIEGMIDKTGLKQLVSTLKDLKDIHMSITGEEISEEGDGGIIEISEVQEEDTA